jgi:hypothetical protein
MFVGVLRVLGWFCARHALCRIERIRRRQRIVPAERVRHRMRWPRHRRTNVCAREHIAAYVCAHARTCTPTGTLAAFAFDCSDADDGDYSNPEQPCSNLYVTCSSHVAVYRACPANTKFDNTSLECLERMWVTDCGGVSTTRLPWNVTTVESDTS